MPLTPSEKNICDWLLSKGIDLDEWFATDDEGKRQLAKSLGRDYYVKGRTENFERRLDDFNIWKDVAPEISDKAEEKVVDPKLAVLERITGEVNTRREIRAAKEDYSEIPREKLSQPQRIERYDKIGNTLGTIEKVMDEMEAEAALLGRAPEATVDERRNVNALLGEARARGITAAGGQTIAQSHVRYRAGTSPKEFDVRYYPVTVRETKPTTAFPEGGAVISGERWEVFKSETGERIGSFDHKPDAREIKEKWRG